VFFCFFFSRPLFLESCALSTDVSLKDVRSRAQSDEQINSSLRKKAASRNQGAT
jgi:hypothetical protein